MFGGSGVAGVYIAHKNWVVLDCAVAEPDIANVAFNSSPVLQVCLYLEEGQILRSMEVAH